MLALDTDTVILSSSILNICVGATFLAFHERGNAIRIHLCGSMVSYGCAGLLIGFREFLPPWFANVFANMVVGWSIVLLHRGSWIMAGKTPPDRVYLVSVLALGAIYYQFTYPIPHAGIRLLAVSLFRVPYFLSIVLTLRYSRQFQEFRGGKALIWLLLIGACWFLLRGCFAITTNILAALFRTGYMQSINFFIVAILNILIALAFSRVDAEQACDNLEGQVQERTAVLGQTNHSLEMEITERKRLESEKEQIYKHLEISTAFLDSVIEQSPISMTIYDDKGTLIRANQSLRNLFGIMDDELIGRYNILKNNVIEEQGFMPQVRDVFEKGTSTRFIIDYDTSQVQNLNLPKRTRAVLDVTVSAVQTPDGRVSHVIVQHLNITRLQAALTEKEVLLKEVHHRVKNNLQVISSLLEMTRSRTADPEISNTLADASARINSLSIIHSQLYRNSQFDRIYMKHYIEILVNHLLRMYGKNRQIAVNMDTHEAVLSLVQAMPCALVFNELITNSLKHAWQPGQTGIITISIEITSDNDVSVFYRDDGIGIAEDMCIQKVKTLGMKLVHILVTQQLKGNLIISRNNGTEISFDFKSGLKQTHSETTLLH